MIGLKDCKHTFSANEEPDVIFGGVGLELLGGNGLGHDGGDEEEER